MNSIRANWLSRLVSSEPADRPQAESALRDLYAAACLPVPGYFFWFDSPFQAALAMILLTAPKDHFFGQIVAALDRKTRDRQELDQVRGQLCRAASQADWKALSRVTGESLSPGGMRSAMPARSIHSQVSLSRLKIYENVMDAVSHFNEKDPLQRAEGHLGDVMSGQERWGAINPLLNSSFYNHYTFSMMAADEAAAGEREAPPAVAAAWRVARTAGVWWPFANCVVLSDRPAEIHLNAEFLLHREAGPAAIFRDGTNVWAWNGQAMREEWILRPESIPAKDLEYFDAGFRAYAAARAPTVTPKGKLKPSPILTSELPPGAEEQTAALRKHNNGRLPLFDRYMAGEHEKVWEEIIALGPSVREDPYAADALAVAYETMRRVERNVRTVTAQLRALDYKFTDEPHELPGPKARRQIAQLEKRAGALPLSLRAFYEVVGAVNWIGEHPSLAPRADSVAPDPLVVFAVEDALAQCESGWLEDGDCAIVIAPDDLHKSNTSGGPPYEIAVPDLNADGKLLNEGHDLYFVDYLRMAFRFGGFPGYNGIDPEPPELATLKQGLVSF